MSDLRGKHERNVERVMGEASAKGIKYKSPRRVAHLMTRAVDQKTGKVYHGENGLRLQERNRKIAGQRDRHK